MKLVDQLTKEYEYGAESPWQVDWSDTKIRNMVKSIVGTELKVLLGRKNRAKYINLRPSQSQTEFTIV